MTHLYRGALVAVALAVGCDNEPPKDDDSLLDVVPDGGWEEGSGGGSDGGGSDGGGTDDGGSDGTDDGGDDGTTTTEVPPDDPDPEPDWDDASGIVGVFIDDLDCSVIWEAVGEPLDCDACTYAFDTTLYIAESSCGFGDDTRGVIEVRYDAVYWEGLYWGRAEVSERGVRWESDLLEGAGGYTYLYYGELYY